MPFSDKLATLLVRGLMVLVAAVFVGGILYWLGGAAKDFIQAPAQLEAAIGNNQALAKGAEAQNKGVDGLVTAGKKRKAESEKAVAGAGKKEEARVRAILEAAPVGETDYERAVNRIDRELGLR